MSQDGRESFVRRKREEQAGYRSDIRLELVSALVKEFVEELGHRQVTIIEGCIVADGIVRTLLDRAFTGAAGDEQKLNVMKEQAYDVFRAMESFVMAWPAVEGKG